MQIYCVGGAVRDELLGLPVTDRDFVVVGSSPEELIKLGFKPVGQEFPVFLHPQSHEEYALARTERKVSVGYKGFEVYASPEVTLEQDLARRDITINAIAKDENGKIIDPFNGIDDLRAGILRHVSPSFVEDPVRILRIARFAARYEFAPAEETIVLMREMVRNGEVGSLVPERVWQELARGLMERKPSRMISTLQEVNALAVVMPELEEQFQTSDVGGRYTLRMLDVAAQQQSELALRFAILNYHFGDKRNTTQSRFGLERANNLCKRLKAPNDCRDLALLTVRFSHLVEKVFALTNKDILNLFDEADVYRKPHRFFEMLEVCGVAHRMHSDVQSEHDSKAGLLRCALQAAQSVDAGKIAQCHTDVLQIKSEILRERSRAVSLVLEQSSGDQSAVTGSG